ncbi:MAG: iron ABC transporter substrate-binding protein [Bacteroidales bacterium]|jgi:iron complex transport system substrate-binding protein|nr:iron ABC transporter substrate-binding protein [Bacteroidales bacterium]
MIQTKRNTPAILLAATLTAIACGCSSIERTAAGTAEVKDMLGRQVTVPLNVQRIVGIRAGTLRLLLYMGASGLIAGIEDGDARNPRPYLTPYPHLQALPVIGPAMGGDAEMILNVRPDVIFTSYTTVGDADALQKKTGIPVVALACPEMATGARDTLYASLRLIGEVLGRRERADSLAAFMQSMIRELDERTAGIPAGSRPAAYIGGVSYSGAKGITSTQPYFPPFTFTNSANVASALDKSVISHVKGTYIDREQLLMWNPDVIFIDESGLRPALGDLRTGRGLDNLKAVKNGNIYTLLPYNNYSVNYETVLVNSWYVGKILYPEHFTDTDLRAKGNEISEMFFGRPVFDQWLTEHSYRATGK